MAKVLVIGDTHCPAMHPRYPSFLQRIYKRHKCTKVVHIGDLVDNAAISYHEKSPSSSSAEEEFWKAKMQVAKIAAYFPNVIWMTGNHDALTERQATTAGMPIQMLKELPELWGVPGWTCYPRYSRYTLDGVIYAHGDSGKGGMYSSVKNSRDNFGSFVCGHHHSEAGVWYTTVENHRVFGMNVGCGVDPDSLAFSYGRKFNKKPTLGCGVVIDGKQAIFEPM
jgi:predicted phosphodiesterase